MTSWKVLQDDRTDEFSSPCWREVGEHESDQSYWLGLNAPQQIGEKYGAGEYLLLSEEGQYQRLTIGARQEFYEIEAPDPRLCDFCGADIDGNDPHNPECPNNLEVPAGIAEGSPDA